MSTYQKLGDLFRSKLPTDAQPKPETWQQIQRRMKRIDFWQTKGKTATGILVGTLLIGSVVMVTMTMQKNQEQAHRLSGQTNTFIVTHADHPDPEAQQTEATSMEVRVNAITDSKPAESSKNKSHITEPSQASTSVPSLSEDILSQGTLSETTSAKSSADLNALGEPTKKPSTHHSTQQSTHQSAHQSAQSSLEHPVWETNSTTHVAVKSDNQTNVTTYTRATAESEATRDSLQIAFPSAFTPNGDGLNDEYIPIISGETDQYLLRIYSSNQQLLFQTSHQDEAWDGTCRGKEQAHGLYIYILQCTDKHGRNYFKRGEFLLLKH